MKRIACSLIVVAVAACRHVPALPPAQAIAEGAEDGFVLRRLGSGIEPSLNDGVPAKNGDWPATFYFASGSCTATAIGKRVVLTAAHCVRKDGALGRIEPAGTHVWCYRHPRYDPQDASGKFLDFALCRAQSDIGGGPYEVIGTDPTPIPAGREIWLLGYGCTQDDGSDHSYGTLREGGAEVVENPEPNGWIVTLGGASLCHGDSGGGAYRMTGSSRTLVAVNQRHHPGRWSWLAPTGSTSFLEWARTWSGEDRICGLDAAAEKCRP